MPRRATAVPLQATMPDRRRRYAGPFERLQELEDEGEFDAIVAPAPPGDGYWALPEEWGVASNMLAGGGITLLNDVPAL